MYPPRYLNVCHCPSKSSSSTSGSRSRQHIFPIFSLISGRSRPSIFLPPPIPAFHLPKGNELRRRQTRSILIEKCDYSPFSSLGSESGSNFNCRSLSNAACHKSSRLPPPPQSFSNLFHINVTEMTDGRTDGMEIEIDYS